MEVMITLTGSWEESDTYVPLKEKRMLEPTVTNSGLDSLSLEESSEEVTPRARRSRRAARNDHIGGYVETRNSHLPAVSTRIYNTADREALNLRLVSRTSP